MNRRGHSTFSLLCVIGGLLCGVLMIVRYGTFLTLDKRHQAAADRAAGAAGFLAAERANAIAAMNTAAAEALAHAAVGAASCRAVQAAAALEAIPPQLAWALVRGQRVCVQEAAGRISTVYRQLAWNLLDRSLDLYEMTEATALAAATDNAAQMGAYDVVIQPDAGLIPAHREHVEALCPYAREVLAELLHGSVFYTARGSPEGALVYGAFRNAAHAELEADCARPDPVVVLEATEVTRALVWVEAPEQPRRLLLGTPAPSSQADLAATGLVLGHEGGGGPHDQTWWSRLGPLGLIPADTLAAGPALPWADLVH